MCSSILPILGYTESKCDHMCRPWQIAVYFWEMLVGSLAGGKRILPQWSALPWPSGEQSNPIQSSGAKQLLPGGGAAQ